MNATPTKSERKPELEPIFRHLHPTIRMPEPDSPVIEFTASDETVDRYGEVIMASGWILDQYRKNPVFLNSHQYDDIRHAIGTTEEIDVHGPALWQRVRFAVEANPVAKVAHALYKGGFLRAVSVGFTPLNWLDPREENPKANAGRIYTSQELLEVSAVVIPANPNALMNCVRNKSLCFEDLGAAHELLSGLHGAMLQISAAAPVQDPRDQVRPAVAADHSGQRLLGALGFLLKTMRGK